MSEKPVLYRGENRSFNGDPIPFNTVIGFTSSDLEGSMCGMSGKVMYFLKDTEYGYWNAQSPWMNFPRFGPSRWRLKMPWIL